MLGRLRSLFRAVTRLGSCPAGWPPFRPSLECLGDRALPSAGHAAAAGGAAHPGHEAAHAAPDHPEAEKSSAHAPPHAAVSRPTMAHPAATETC